MDFLEGLKGLPLGEAGGMLVSEGIGVAGGFMSASVIGRRSEDFFQEAPITAADTTTKKVGAWAANNVPKMAAWYLLKQREHTGELVIDLKKAFAGSIVYDTVVRLAQEGVPARFPTILGLDSSVDAGNQQAVHKLIQENGILKTELNKAMKQLASGAPVVQVQELPQSAAYPEIRRREYGFMDNASMYTPPAVYAREKRFGFAGDDGQAAKMFGMK